jgi:ferredoxin
MAKIIVNDSMGAAMAQFQSDGDESIATEAMDNGAPVPVSCGVGACRTCVAKVTKGKEFIDEEAIGPKQIPTEDDEVLTCICASKQDAPADAVIEIEVANL